MMIYDNNYNEEFRHFLKECGHNQGEGFFGKWAWRELMREKFENTKQPEKKCQ